MMLKFVWIRRLIPWINQYLKEIPNRIFTLIKRPWFLTTLIVQLICFYILFTHPSFNVFYLKVYIAGLVLGALAFYWLELWGHILPSFAKPIFSFFMGLLIAFAIVANYYTNIYLGEFLTLFMLTFVLNDYKYLYSYLQTYLFNINLLWFAIFVSLFVYVWRPRLLTNKYLNRKRIVIRIFITIIPFLIILNYVRYRSPGKIISMDASTIVAVKNLFKYVSSPNELYSAKHDDVKEVIGQEKPDFNIVLVINESWTKKGLSFYGSSDTAMPRMQRWINEEKNNFFIYPYAFTNSGATDLSVPSMLTGVAPYEGVKKLHRMPFLWDWAKSVGLKTFFVSSYNYRFAHFDKFFLSPGPDEFVTAEQIPSPTINDYGVDDLVSIQYFCDAVKRIPTDQYFLGIFNSNALHIPFQQTSELLDKQPNFSSRVCNAQYILDSALDFMIKCLQQCNKLDETFFIFTADHCDLDFFSHEIPRLYSFYDEAVCIPFVVRIPPKWHKQKPEIVAMLRENLARNIANIDIVPTIISLIRANENDYNKKLYSELMGQTLTKPISSDRFIITINTNEIREWNHEGFAIIYKNYRLVASDVEKIKLFDIGADPEQKNDIWNKISEQDKIIFLNIINSYPVVQRIFLKIK